MPRPDRVESDDPLLTPIVDTRQDSVGATSKSDHETDGEEFFRLVGMEME